jgi:endonuclease YncB( thermonuclease family)
MPGGLPGKQPGEAPGGAKRPRRRARPSRRGLWAALALLGALWVAQTALGETLTGPLPARVVEVVDGDTLGVRVRIWLDQEVTTRVRLAGIDAPELRGLCERERTLARRAAAFVVGKVMAEAPEDNVVRLTDVRYGKYARRVVARVETRDGEDLGQALLDAGLARAYDGGRRLSWCEG